MLIPTPQESMTFAPDKTATKAWAAIVGVLLVLFIYVGVRGYLFGWVCVGLFGAWLAWLAVELCPGSSSLTLTNDGFIIRSRSRDSYYPWKSISGINVGRRGAVKAVVFDFATGFRGPKFTRLMAQTLAGHDAVLPNNYGMSADALAVLMKRWQAKYSEGVELS